MAEKDEKAEVSSEGEVLSDEQREQNTEVCHHGRRSFEVAGKNEEVY